MASTEGICITSLNYTVARDKIKARKRCCCSENIDDEMATLDLCLVCGKSAVKKDRQFLDEAVIMLQYSCHDLQLFWLDSSKLPECFS